MNITSFLDPLINNTKTSKLFQDLQGLGYDFTSLQYPEELGSRNAGMGHYMMFFINENTNYKKSTETINKKIENSGLGGVLSKVSSKVNDTISNTVSNAVKTAENIFKPAIETFNKIGNANQRLGGDKVHKRISSAIMLYMPENISSESSTNWENSELGAVWAVEAISALKLFANNPMEVLQDALGTAKTNLQNASFANSFDDMVYSGNLGDEMREVWEAKHKKLKNPHMEFLFKSINPRTFQYEFKFTPKSASEAQTVKQIIQKFRMHAAPSISETTAFGVYWNYPSTFDIVFISNGNENSYINKVSTCALSAINVNYTGAGQWAAMRDVSGEGSPPMHTTLSLTFTELDLLSREKIEAGY